MTKINKLFTAVVSFSIATISTAQPIFFLTANQYGAIQYRLELTDDHIKTLNTQPLVCKGSSRENDSWQITLFGNPEGDSGTSQISMTLPIAGSTEFEGFAKYNHIAQLGHTLSQPNQLTVALMGLETMIESQHDPDIGYPIKLDEEGPVVCKFDQDFVSSL